MKTFGLVVALLLSLPACMTPKAPAGAALNSVRVDVEGGGYGLLYAFPSNSGDKVAAGKELCYRECPPAGESTKSGSLCPLVGARPMRDVPPSNLRDQIETDQIVHAVGGDHPDSTAVASLISFLKTGDREQANCGGKSLPVRQGTGSAQQGGEEASASTAAGLGLVREQHCFQPVEAENQSGVPLALVASFFIRFADGVEGWYGPHTWYLSAGRGPLSVDGWEIRASGVKGHWSFPGPAGRDIAYVKDIEANFLCNGDFFVLRSGPGAVNTGSNSGGSVKYVLDSQCIFHSATSCDACAGGTQLCTSEGRARHNTRYDIACWRTGTRGSNNKCI